MSAREILEAAIKLRPQERFLVVEALIKSLDEPDANLDAIWADEAERRLAAYRAGLLEGVPIEAVFEDWK
jgi:putative addiction module component (TIGR02574 family)